MYWLKRDIRKVGLALVGLLLFLVLMVWIPLSANAYEGTSGLATSVMAQATPTVDVTATMTALNEEKLRQEIQQLKNQNGNQNNWLAGNSTALIAAVATVIVALFGILQWAITVRQAQDKDLRDRDNERRKEITAQEKESRDRQEAQDKELRAQAEERFKSAVTALGNENEATQVGGAILLRSFLNQDDKEIYGRYYAQIFDLSVAYLRASNETQPSRDSTPMPLTSLRQALIVVLQESYPLARDILMNQRKSEFDHRFLNASSICLDQAYLVESHLEHIWMIDASLIEVKLGRAKLHKADLRRAIIRRTFLNGADLSEARLFQAIFEDSDLSRADLSSADLRGVKLNGTILTNANLSGADLSGLTVRGDNISAANPEAALSLEGTNLRGVIGLTKEQLLVCKAKGAIIDEDKTTSSSQPDNVPPSPSQSSDAQALSSTPAQVNTPPPSTEGSSSATSQPSAEP